MDVLVGLLFTFAVLGAIGWAITRLVRTPDRSQVDALHASIRDLTRRLELLERRGEAPRPGAMEAGAPAAIPAPEASREPMWSQPAPAAPPAAQLPTHPLPTHPLATHPLATHPLATHPLATHPLATQQVAEESPAKQSASWRSATRPPAAGAPASPRADASLETFLGSRVMLVAGVVVGLFGVAFFLKYAIDHGWIGPALRIAMGVLAGVALLVGGDRLRRRGYDVFGQALMGCGLGAVYLSNYFASTRYGFLGQGSAFFATAVITAVGATLAVRRNAPALAHLGFLGGYLAPALLATSTGNLGGLTTWLLVVDAGVLAVLLLRVWKGLDLMAILFAGIYYAAWYGSHGRTGDFPGHSGYLALLVIASLVLGLAPPIVRRVAPGPLSLGGAACVGVYAVIAGHALLHPTWRWELGVAIVLVGAVYFVAARLLLSRVAGSLNEVASLLGFSAAALATSIAVALSGNVVPLAFSMAGVAVVYAGMRMRQRVLLTCGVGMIGLAFADLLVHSARLFNGMETPFLNERFAVCAVPCVALLACARIMSRVGNLPPAAPTFVAAAGLWALPIVIGADMMCGAFIDDAVRFEHRLAATTLALAVYGAVVARLFGAGREGAGRQLALGPIGMAMLFGLWLLFQGHLTPFTPGWSATFAAGLVLVAAGLHAASTAARSVRGVLGTLSLLYLLALITAEIHAWGEHRLPVGFDRREARFIAVVWISVAWAGYASALVGCGFRTQRAGMRWLGLAVFALTIAKVFVLDMAQLQPVYRIGSFLALGALLLAASFLYQRARRSDDKVGPTARRSDDSSA